MGDQRQKLLAVIGVLLLVSVGPATGTVVGGGLSVAAGNEPGMGNQSGIGAGNQPVLWNNSTEPGADTVDELGPRADDSRPYAVVGDRQPTDPTGEGLVEDVNGDGELNVVDADALYRHLSDTAVGANWSAYDYTGDNRTDIGDVQWLFNATRPADVTDSDGDGLPDTYERTVVGTDPDAADTDGDGVIDGLADADGDGLTNYAEYRGETNATRSDTDGDGLPDGTESDIDTLDPLVADSDGDGTPDGAEDFDDDGLPNAAEVGNGTDLFAADTDGDGLSDGTELDGNVTDPLSADSDGDSIPDRAERTLGTDPTTDDTDGDDIPDPSESYTRTYTVDGANATVSVGGTYDEIIGVETRAVTGVNATETGVGPTVRVASEVFGNATVSVEFPDSVTDSARENLTLVARPLSGSAGVAPIDTAVDNGTVRGTITESATVSLVRWDEWANGTTYTPTPEERREAAEISPIDTSLVIDTSGSMQGERIEQARIAARSYVNELGSGDRAGVVTYAYRATVEQDLTTSASALNRSIDSLGYPNGGSNFSRGIEAARGLHEPQADREQAMVLVSDGRLNNNQPDVRNRTIEQAEKAAEEGITIYTVGIYENDGISESERFLQNISSLTGGTYYEVDDPRNLSDSLLDIRREVEFVDSDDDGLPDVVETGQITVPYGPDGRETVTTDPNDPDTDGDGLSDGEEVALQRVDRELPTGSAYGDYANYSEDPSWYAVATSDPTDPNSDDVGRNDTRERQLGTDPLVPDRHLVGLALPTVADANGTVQSPGNATDGRALAVTETYRQRSAPCPVFGGTCDSEPPEWVTAHTNDSARTPGTTFYRVPVVLRQTVDGAADVPATPVAVSLHSTGTANTTVYNGRTTLTGDAQQRTLVVATDCRNCSTAALGAFELTVRTDGAGPFDRETAENTTLVTSADFGPESVDDRNLTRRARSVAATWRAGAVTAITPSGSNYTVTVDGLTARHVYDFRRTRPASEEAAGGVRLAQIGGPTYAVTAAHSEVYVTFRGPALARAN